MDPSISTGHGEEPAEASACAEPSAAEPSPFRPPLLHSKSELPLPRPKPRPTISSSTVPTTSGIKLKRESLISLGDEFDYGLPPGGSGSATRDRSRVERWLEQQCRFSTFAQDEDVGAEGADRGVDGTSRGEGVVDDEEAVLPYVDESVSKTREPTSLSLSTTEEALGGSRGGITSSSPSPAREAAVEALPPLSSLSVSPAANAPSERAHAPAHNAGADAHAPANSGADRADSPLLGYTSAPESPVDTFLSGCTGTGTGGAGGAAGAAVLQARPAGFGRHVHAQEASDRLQVHEGLGLASSELGPGPAGGVDEDEDEDEDEDALLRPPDRKFTYGSDLPVNVSSESLALLHPMVAEDMTTRRVREREQLVVDGERDKVSLFRD
ncbi:hypothetical protein CVT26_007515 [Gymnopilus dilepis]|uniref:Uncharacterized protein n=1 Tax=Gymnopilus dilepis TaxID=231916 RepID=A0A409WI06_9AGAR|nr:hypothetical protein CVT26_007515 [Gymnopilus dilepis]